VGGWWQQIRSRCASWMPDVWTRGRRRFVVGVSRERKKVTQERRRRKRSEVDGEAEDEGQGNRRRRRQGMERWGMSWR